MHRPDFEHPSVGAAMLSEWNVGPIDQQRAAVDAAVAHLTGLPWPEGLISRTFGVTEEAGTVLDYAQWSSAAAHRGFRDTEQSGLLAAVRRVAPDAELPEPTSYYLHRGGSSGDPERQPGAVIAIHIETGDVERSRAWIDAVHDALAADPAPNPAGLSGYFHISTDGTKVLNYTEWESAQAHRDHLAGADPDRISPQWRRVHTMPGVTFPGLTRYFPHNGLTRPRTSGG